MADSASPFAFRLSAPGASAGNETLPDGRETRRRPVDAVGREREQERALELERQRERQRQRQAQRQARGNNGSSSNGRIFLAPSIPVGARGDGRAAVAGGLSSLSAADRLRSRRQEAWSMIKHFAHRVWSSCLCVRWNDPALSRWQVLVTFGLPWIKRLFIVFLIVFTLALCANVFASPTATDDSWLYWKPFKGALVFTAVVIGIVQCVAIVFIIWINYQQASLSSSSSLVPISGAETVAARRRRRKHWLNLFLKNVESIFIFLFFEWTVINVTTLFVSVSALGLPWFGSYATGFGVTFASCIVQYAIFVRQYVKRKPLLQWGLKDSYLIVMPITLFLLGAAFLFLISIINAPPQQTIQNWLAATVVLSVFSLTIPPLILHRLFIKRYQRRVARRAMRSAAQSSSSSATLGAGAVLLSPSQRILASHGYGFAGGVLLHPSVNTVGPANSPVEEVIRKRCRELQVDRDQLQSLMLVGMDVRDLLCLQGCTGLKRLYLSNNCVTFIDAIDEIMPGLECLHLDDNLLGSCLDLMPLRRLSRLTRLTVERNPLCSVPGFELSMLMCMMPQLSLINGVTVTPEASERAVLRHHRWLQELCLAYQEKMFTQLAQNECSGVFLQMQRMRHRRSFAAPSRLRIRESASGGITIADRGFDAVGKLSTLFDEHMRQAQTSPQVSRKVYIESIAKHSNMWSLAESIVASSSESRLSPPPAVAGSDVPPPFLALATHEATAHPLLESKHAALAPPLWFLLPHFRVFPDLPLVSREDSTSAARRSVATDGKHPSIAHGAGQLVEGHAPERAGGSVIFVSEVVEPAGEAKLDVVPSSDAVAAALFDEMVETPC